MLTHVISAPAATMTQPYAGPLGRVMSRSTLKALSAFILALFLRLRA
jgi:hypothetical protein